MKTESRKEGVGVHEDSGPRKQPVGAGYVRSGERESPASLNSLNFTCGMWNHPRGHVWNVFVRPASS